MPVPSPRFRNLLLAIVATAALCPAAQADDKVTLLLDWLPAPAHAALYGGKAAGLYAREGIDLEIDRGFGSTDTVARLSAGNGAFGVASVAAVMLGKRQSKTDAVMILPLQADNPYAVFSLEKTGIKSLKDLEGRRVAMSPYASSAALWPALLQASNVDATKVTVFNMEPEGLANALASGYADAIVDSLTHRPRIAAGAQQTPLSTTRFADQGFNLYELGLVASAKYLDGHQDQARRFVRATLASVAWCQAHIAECAAALPPEARDASEELTVASVREALALAGTMPGTIDTAELAKTWGELALARGLDPAIDPESFADRRFLP